MRPSIAVASVIAAIMLSQGADAGFIAAAAKGAAEGVAAGALAAVRASSAAAARAITTGAKAMGSAISKTFARLPEPVVSGLTSGTTSGTISGSVGIGIGVGITKKEQRDSGGIKKKDHKRASAKMRRTVQSQKLYERELLGSSEIREDDGPGEAPEGINQADWERCYVDGMHAHVVITGPVDGDNTVKIDGIPPSCMSVSMTPANNPEEPIPEACGHTCLKFKDMSAEEYAGLKGFFE